jgi:hypothetical protein
MKIRTKFSMAAMITISVTLVLVFGSCTNDTDKKCCEGYTGKLTNGRSMELVNKCHFLSKDSIELWTNKYEEYKKRLGSDKDSITAVMDKVSAGFLRSGSVSFNSCIIKKILCNENSIGLRVLYGIGGDGRIHIILVGINADYTNLYIDGKDCCDKSINKSLANGASGAGGSGTGGAEYGQIP